jgi:hypothetical protein
MRKYENHIITPDALTIIFNEGHPISIGSEDGRYADVISLIRSGQYDEIMGLVDRSEQIKEHTQGKFLVRNGVVVIDNEPLPEALSDKLLEFCDEKIDTRPLELFWHNLKKNPSKDSKRDLYDFMRANLMPITPNGHFIGYKKVRSDYKDCFTGTITNKPGRIIKMLRAEVDGNRNNTCSRGLHVAAYSYASGFGSGVLLEVEVNPRDVVAVPPDYKQQKMRVCRYRVIRRANHEIRDLIYNHRRKPAEFDALGRESEIRA